MKIKNSKILILVVTIVLVISACKKNNDEEKTIRPVKIMEIGLNSTTETVVFPGIVTPSKETIMSFKIAGPIVNVNLTVGQKVKKDEVLAEMDTRDYKINFEVYKKKYDAAKATADNAVFQYNRAEKLYKADAMTKKNFDIITAQKKAAISILKEAEQGVVDAKNKLDDTQLKAPYDGYISKKFVDSGSVVNIGTPIVVITAEETPEININIAGKDISLLENSTEFFFIPNDSLDTKYSLKLKEIGKNPEFSKITYPVIFEIKGKSDDIRIGSSGKVIAKSNQEEEINIIIPLTALFEDKGSKVYIYDKGIVKARDVKIGNLYPDGKIIILEGLYKNDRVIINGVTNITDGEKVKILPEPSKTNIGNIL